MKTTSNEIAMPGRDAARGYRVRAMVSRLLHPSQRNRAVYERIAEEIRASSPRLHAVTSGELANQEESTPPVLPIGPCCC